MNDPNERLIILAAKGPNAESLERMMPLVAKALQVVSYYGIYWQSINVTAASRALIAIEEELQ